MVGWESCCVFLDCDGLLLVYVERGSKKKVSVLVC